MVLMLHVVLHSVFCTSCMLGSERRSNFPPPLRSRQLARNQFVKRAHLNKIGASLAKLQR